VDVVVAGSRAVEDLSWELVLEARIDGRRQRFNARNGSQPFRTNFLGGSGGPDLIWCESAPDRGFLDGSQLAAC
jgi:hypothetical protein